MSASEKEQGACAPAEPAGTLDADAAKAIAAYREKLAHTLGGRDLLRVFLIVDEAGGVGGVGCDIAEIDRKVIVGPAGGIERWAGIITDVVERLNRQPDADSLEWLVGELRHPKITADAEYHPGPVAEYRRNVASKHDGREEPHIRVWLPAADGDDTGGHIVYERKLSGGFGLTEEVVRWVDAEVRDEADKPVQVEASEQSAPTPCTLNLRDAAKAPEPTYRDYAEIEKYRKSESPALGGSEICYLHVGLEPREDGGGTVPVHGQTIIGPHGTVERLIQHIDAVAGKFAGGGVAANANPPTDAQPTTKPAEWPEDLIGMFGPRKAGLIMGQRQKSPQERLRVCLNLRHDDDREEQLTSWDVCGPHGTVEKLANELCVLTERVDKYGSNPTERNAAVTEILSELNILPDDELPPVVEAVKNKVTQLTIGRVPADALDADAQADRAMRANIDVVGRLLYDRGPEFVKATMARLRVEACARAESESDSEAAGDEPAASDSADSGPGTTWTNRTTCATVWADEDGDVVDSVRFWGGDTLVDKIIIGLRKLAAEIASDHADTLPDRFRQEADRLQAAANAGPPTASKPTASSKDYKSGGAHYESVSCNRGRYNIVVFDGDSDSKLDIEVMGTRREVVGGVRDFAVTLLQRRADELAEVEGGAS